MAVEGEQALADEHTVQHVDNVVELYTGNLRTVTNHHPNKFNNSKK